MVSVKNLIVKAGNHSASRRGFLCLSRVLPTSQVFTSGYVNTETILHFFNNKKSKNKIFDRHTHIPGKSKMLNGPRYDAFFFLLMW